MRNNIKKSIIVEGESLACILEDEDNRKLFIEMAPNCETVICCRVTPK